MTSSLLGESGREGDGRTYPRILHSILRNPRTTNAARDCERQVMYEAVELQ